MDKSDTGKERKEEMDRLTAAGITGAAAETVQRYGSAVKEHAAAYAGQDNESGKQLKKGLKEYIQSGEAERNSAWIHASVSCLNSTGDICRFIQNAHEIYVKRKNSVEEDCLHIVLLCHQVVAAVLRLIKGDEIPCVLPAAS